MVRISANGLRALRNTLREASGPRLKIVGFSSTQNFNELQVQVLLVGIKSQLPISYRLEEIVKDLSILSCFSQQDLTLLQFLSAYPAADLAVSSSLVLLGQEWVNNKTVIVFSRDGLSQEYRKFAADLSMDFDLLTRFSIEDVVCIVSAATQEQVLEDFL